MSCCSISVIFTAAAPHLRTLFGRRDRETKCLSGKILTRARWTRIPPNDLRKNVAQLKCFRWIIFSFSTTTHKTATPQNETTILDEANARADARKGKQTRIFYTSCAVDVTLHTRWHFCASGRLFGIREGLVLGRFEYCPKRLADFFSNFRNRFSRVFFDRTFQNII